MNNQERINALQSLRTPKNSHVIDAAIADGRTPEETALYIVKAGLVSNKSSQQQTVDAIAAAMMNEMAKDPYMAAKLQMMNAKNEGPDVMGVISTGDEIADAITAEINKLRNQNR